jgi:UPF0271 protein
MPRVDLNCDLGEGSGSDAELMSIITSANIACGGHAGDEGTMRAAVALARRHEVAIGAHPGLEDREKFGRGERPLAPDEVRRLVLHQTRALQRIAGEEGFRLSHVKLHGALYNLTAREWILAEAAAQAVAEIDAGLIFFGLAGSAHIRAGKEAGLTVAEEVFADRAYQADGMLLSRETAGAVIEDEATVVGRALRMVTEGRVHTADGLELVVQADTICLHGDHPKAIPLARRIARELAAAGIELRRPGA